MFKKLTKGLSLLLVLCMMVSLFPVGALATEVEEPEQQAEVTDTVSPGETPDEGEGLTEEPTVEDETPSEPESPAEPEDPAEQQEPEVPETPESPAEPGTPTVQAPQSPAEPAAEQPSVDEPNTQTEEGIAPQAMQVGDKPADGKTAAQPFASGTGDSANFRIPALVTLSDGTLVAAADARWNTAFDGYGLDTIVSRSSDNGANWSYTFANYLGDNGNVYDTYSTAFIDPALAVATDDTIYMLVDLFPHSTYISTVKAGTGFDSNGHLLLRAFNGSSYDYYVGNFSNGSANVYKTDGTQVPDYTVDEHYNISGNGVNTNLFFSDSPYQVLSTSYLYLTKSTDGGKTWSAPTMLNSQVKAASDQFYGVGPGGGIVTSTGRIIFPCYTYTYANGDGRTSVIYSDDNGTTWTRSADMNVRTSEASISEVTVNGQHYLYMFTRYGGYFVSGDDGTTWSTQCSVSDILYTTSCELSTLTYSETIDGRPAILLSAPTNDRTCGKIFVGLVQDDLSISWKYTYSVNFDTYQYSDLAELSDGSIGLLYENGSASITYTNIAITDIAPDAVVGTAKEVKDEITGISVSAPGLTSVRVTEVTSSTPYTGYTKSVTYSITLNDGTYTDKADIQIPYDKDVFAGCTEFIGSVANNDGTSDSFSVTLEDDVFTGTVPHFSEVTISGRAMPTAAETKDVTLYVGQSQTITDSTGNHESSYTDAGLDTGVATIAVKGTTVAGGTTKTLGSTVSMNSNGTYTGVISDLNGNYLVLDGTTISSTADINKATEWTVTRSGTSRNPNYKIKSGSYYLKHSSNTLSASTGDYSNTWSYSDGFYSTSGRTYYYLRTDNGSWQLSNFTSNNGQLYSVTTTTTDPVDATDITITGVRAGSTSVVVGSTRYNITVKEAPEYVDLATTPFVANTGVGDGKKITKLTTSVSLTFDVDLAAGSGGTWRIADQSIATVDQSGKVTGVSEGETTLTWTSSDGKVYTMPVVIRKDATSSSVKIYDFYASEITNTSVYYVWNCDSNLNELQEGEALYVSFDQTVNTCCDFFGKPEEGYALTRMTSTNSDGAYFLLHTGDHKTVDMGNTGFYDGTIIYNGTVTNGAGKNQQGKFGSTNGKDNVLVTTEAAIAAGCDGGMGFTRLSDNTKVVTSDLTFRSEKLPTVDKTIATVGGKDYTEGMTAETGDKIVYNVTVTQYAAQDAIDYSNASLKDNLSGATFLVTHFDTQTVNDLSNTALNVNKTITYQVEYTIQDKDLDTDIINTVDLSYTYQAQYSSGSFGGSASAEAKISAPTFTPHDIVIDFGLPVVIDYSGADQHGRYNLVSGEATYGTVSIENNKVTYTPTTVLQEKDTVTLTNEKGTKYRFDVYPATTVYYEEGFIQTSGSVTVNGQEVSLSGFESKGTAGTTPQTTSAVGSKARYGYDSAYGNPVGPSNGTQAVSTKTGSTAAFTFTGTGVDIYTNNTANTGTLMFRIVDSEGSLYRLIAVDTHMKNGDTVVTEGQEVTAYNVPVVSLTGMPRDTYHVYISHVKSGSEAREDGVNLDGIRVHGTLDIGHAVYVQDSEANPTFVELRDSVLQVQLGAKAENSEQYADQIAENVMSQVYAQNADVNALVLNPTLSSVTVTESAKVTDLIDNGPKNEIYLRQNETLVFSLNASSAQIGLKALNKATSYTINGKSQTSLNTSTDMFYQLDSGDTYTIQNTGNGILSITELKLFGATEPEKMSAETLTLALRSMGYALSSEPVEPEITYADAQLNLFVQAGSELLTTGLTANGVAGESATFTAADIQAAVEALTLPEGYVLGEQSYTDVTVVYGESGEATFTAVEETVDPEPTPDPDPEPTPDPDPMPDPGFSQPTTILGRILNGLKKLIGIFFR